MSDQSNTKKASNLAGKMLLAMPSIGDKRFEQAVIFVCAHDQQGAMGIVINSQISDVPFNKVIAQTGIQSDIAIDMDQIQVLNGGPVDTSRGFLLHSADFKRNETVQVSSDYAVSGTIDALKDVVSGNGPQRMLFAMGHAGWTAGQLDKELLDNAWLIAEANPSIVFDLPYDQRWKAGLQSIGIDPLMLSSTVGNA